MQYAVPIINISLSIARVYSKLFDKEPSKQAQYLTQSMLEYEKVKLFMAEYAERAGLKEDEMPPEMSPAISIVFEQLEILPGKISRLRKSKS